jgi:hypothetical protein
MVFSVSLVDWDCCVFGVYRIAGVGKYPGGFAILYEGSGKGS